MNKFKVLFSLVLIGMMLLGYVGEAQAQDPAPEVNFFHGTIQFVSGDIGFPDNDKTPPDVVDFYYLDGSSTETKIDYVAPIIDYNEGYAYEAAVPEFPGASTGVDLIIKINERTVAVTDWIAKASVELNLHPPKADAHGGYSIAEGSVLTFNGTAEDVVDSTSLTYEWDFENDGVFDYTGSTGTTTHTYNNVGSYTAVLKVTDSKGGFSINTAAVTVTDVVPTTLTYTGDETGYINQPVTLSATSDCLTVDNCVFAWDLDGDGLYNGTEGATGQSVTYTWTSTGDKTVNFKVTDNDGNVLNNSVTITILRSQIIKLEYGWNLVSFSLIPDDPSVTSLFSGLYDGTTPLFDIVYAWDASATINNWLVYTPGEITNLDNLTNMKGFWIKINASAGATLVVDGTTPTSPTTVPLYDGWNLVSYPSTTSAHPTATLPTGSFNLIFGYYSDDSVDQWKLYDASIAGVADYANDLTLLAQGRGYWVNVISTTDPWNITY